MEHTHKHHDSNHESHEHSENEESNQELSFKASLIERHMQELAEKIEYVSQQLEELEEFNKNIKFIKGSKGKETFASLGRGIYIKSSSVENNLFVNVGSGVVLKKTPEDTAKIIEAQIKSFYEGKNSLMAQIEVYKSLMNQTLASLDKARKK